MSEAVALLIARIGERPVDLAPIHEVAHRLGEWPLLLKLAGAAMRQRMRRGDSLARALQYVNAALDKRGVTAFDPERASDRHEAVASTISISLELLSSVDLILWNLPAGSMRRRWDAHRRGITFLAVTHDWRTAVTGSTDGFLKVWDLDAFTCVRTIPAHHDGITAGAMLADGRYLVSGGADGTIRLWSMHRGNEMIHGVSAHTGKVRALRFITGRRPADDGGFAMGTPPSTLDPQGRVLSGGYDGYLKCWSLPGLTLDATFCADSAIMAADATDDGRIVVAGDAQGCAHFLRVEQVATTGNPGGAARI
jgi:WD40 repeat protein